MTLRPTLATVVAMAMLVLLASLGHAQEAGDGTGGLAPRFDPERRVYDNANVLTDDQDNGFEGDLARLRRLGVEMVVYTRISTDGEAESQAFADEIRTTWQVETAPGADDGLVLLLTYDLNDLARHSIVASWGENTFPIRQLDAAGYEAILADEAHPEIENGRFDFALMYGVRRVLNYADYSPPDPAPLSSTQARLGHIASIVAALTVQALVLGYVIAGVRGSGRITFRPTNGALWQYAAAMAVLGVVTGVLAIGGRNGPAALIALGVFLVAVLVVPLIVLSRGGAGGSPRTVHVRPHATPTATVARGVHERQAVNG